MSVIYHNRTRLSVEREAGAKYVSLKELISQSDVISLNLALNESTRNILGKAEFAEMKTGVVIVNTARSGLVDTEAMIEALDSGKVCATFFASLIIYRWRLTTYRFTLSDLTCMMLNPTSTRD
jgi:lactate dehydrogenase-like 2-hydroxyacid dehydrogenase